jgi:hypothetical protein
LGRSGRGFVFAARLALVVLIASPAGLSRAADERIELIPDERAGWSPSNIFSSHSERTLRVETTPPGAKLDLFYVRAGFQKRFERVDGGTPVTVVLPAPAEAGKRDRVEIRASADGYRVETVSVPVRGDQAKVMIDLQPLDNTLAGVSHIYFADRASLTFLTRTPPQVRLQKGNDSFNVILAQTAQDPRAAAVLADIQNPFIQKVEANQLGEDLLVQVKLAPGYDANRLGARQRQSNDEVRGLSRYTIDLAPDAAAGVEKARSALGSINAGDVSGCAVTFDDALRKRLDPSDLARALSPRGDFTDAYLRTALRRLGEVSGGTIHMADGTSYRSSSPIELSAAQSQAASAKGFLALLRAWVRNVEAPAQRSEALRSLVAPELDTKQFDAALGAADAAERSCHGA